MYDNSQTTQLAKECAWYKRWLFLFPGPYRKQFGEQMGLVFQDLYREELEIRGRVGLQFWASIFFDTLYSAIIQHSNYMKKKGMKTYLQKTLHVNTYNIVGAILLLPFFALLIVDVSARAIQGDLTHYNRPVYHFLSHTPLYWFPVLFTWVILFPTIAVILNLIPLINSFRKKQHPKINLLFLRENMISIVLLGMALGFMAIIKLHDFAPCMVHGILKEGIYQLFHIISLCRNA